LNKILTSPLFGLLVTIFAYELGQIIYRKKRSELLNPLILAMLMIIGFLKVFHIPYDIYKTGGNLINFFLGPLTVALALPLYRQRQLVRKHGISLIVGIIAGVLTSYMTVWGLCTLLKFNRMLTLSSLPKSITNPMAVSLSQMIGGNPAITVSMVIFTGIAGALAAPMILRVTRLTNPVAKGIAIGASSHALGTSKAFELGETEGAMSSVSIGLTGILTVLILPVLLKIFPL
jgi:predicted murein hydrolase (TIGR00659 family)